MGEARRRDHRVTAVVRDPATYRDLAADGVDIVAGDVTDSTLMSQLVTAGLRTEEPTAFILEGLTMYLTGTRHFYH